MHVKICATKVSFRCCVKGYIVHKFYQKCPTVSHICLPLTAAFFITVVLTVLLSVAHLIGIDALSRLAHVLLRRAGGLRREAQAVRLVRTIQTVVLPVADVERVDAGSVTAGELVAAAGIIRTAQLIAAVSAVIHVITATEE